MIKKLVIGVLSIALAVVIALVALSVYSRRAPQLGLVDGRLRPCPDSPNCVCSDMVDASVEPLRVRGPGEAAWLQFADVIAAAGGRVVAVTPEYLHATFETKYLRFIDDFEARLDEAAGVIHVRSASRVGRNDQGVNRERVDRLRARYAAAGRSG